MASLHILRGANQGQRVPLDGDKIIVGRSPECQVVIPMPSASRQHARIVRVQDRHYVEDLQSRNGTFVNNEQITARTELHHGDRIRICDWIAAFADAATPTLMGNPLAPDVTPEIAVEPPSTTFESRSNKTKFFEAQSADNLKVILEISNHLSKTLELDTLWPQIVECLLQLFPQADRCLLILVENGSDRLNPKVIRHREPLPGGSIGFSTSIVRQCLATAQAFLGGESEGGQAMPSSSSVLELRLSSVMCAPLCSAEGKAFGVLQLDIAGRGRKFTSDDLALLWAIANQASIALENARMYQEVQAREEMEIQVELAVQVQRSFLPEHLPQLPGYDFFAHYVPALEVGGDYYDFVALPNRRLAVTIGDVVGKGMSAALLMARLASDCRYCLLAEADPAAAIGRLNDMVYQYTIRTDRFVTLLAALLDPESQMVTLVNAGHLKPLLYRRASGSFHEVFANDVAGTPLGVQKGRRYGAGQFRLNPGDCILLFTDGVSEALNSQGERLQVHGLCAGLQKGGPFVPRTLGQRVVEVVEQFTAGRGPQDDMTVVALQANVSGKTRKTPALRSA
jgi:serine phosphatase RsbU (regulator of sigma subunit)